MTYFRFAHFLIYAVMVRVVKCRQKLHAVSSFKGLEELHIRVRNKELDSNLKYLFQKIQRCDICEEIFNSGYFKHIRIKNVYYSVLPRAYKSKTKTIEVFNTALEDTLTEQVFSCPTTTYQGTLETDVKYFVSKEYDVSGVFSSSEPYAAGRFVFRRTKNVFYYEALAEVPAKAIEGQNVEELYLDIRNERTVADTFSEDPLCKLNIEEKLRICTLVASSSYFMVRKFNFGSSTENVYGRCRKKKIAFRTDYARTELKGRFFKEWMMSCRIKRFHEYYIMYISRAYESHKLFAYSEEERSGRTFLEVLVTNVRGVVDEITSSEN